MDELSIITWPLFEGAHVDYRAYWIFAFLYSMVVCPIWKKAQRKAIKQIQIYREVF